MVYCMNRFPTTMSLSDNTVLRKLTPEANKLITICSNPVMRNTKECVVLWETIDKFNNAVLDSKYEIIRSFNNIQQVDVDEHSERYFR